jgi:hypothetical protein
MNLINLPRLRVPRAAIRLAGAAAVTGVALAGLTLGGSRAEAATPPSAPVVLSVEATGLDRLVITFRDTSPDERGFSYDVMQNDIRVSGGDLPALPGTGAVRSVTAGGLNPATTYCVFVRAFILERVRADISTHVYSPVSNKLCATTHGAAVRPLPSSAIIAADRCLACVPTPVPVKLFPRPDDGLLLTR